MKQALRIGIGGPVGSGKTIELVRGVSFEGLVGAHNGARNLTTGIVTFEHVGRNQHGDIVMLTRRLAMMRKRAA